MAGLADKLAGQPISLATSLASGLGLGPGAPTAAPAAGRFLEIDPARIAANPQQPRRHFDQEALQALAASIGEHGLLEPLLVRVEGGQVVLVAGERRLRAARLAGLTRVPCTVTAGDPAILALIENLHRRDLTPLEEAEAYARLQQERGLSLGQLAKVAGKAKSTVSEILSLAKLAGVKELVAANPDKFPQRVLVELAKQGPGRIEVLANNVAAGQMNSDDLRALRRLPAAKAPAKPKPPREGDSGLARVDALFRRAEQLAGELTALDLDGLNYRQRAYARHSLQPMARALDRLFHHLKRAAHADAQRWTPELRARLLALVRREGMAQARAALGRDLYDDGQPLHPSELAAQLVLARQEAADGQAGDPGAFAELLERLGGGVGWAPDEPTPAGSKG
ncbi:MAG: ParB/RepB/Spo0J family partition protein [Desulfarculus sp.]|nr:ParB/RepB/Spo0J family partition protein [Desulfarculus sp.]